MSYSKTVGHYFARKLKINECNSPIEAISLINKETKNLPQSYEKGILQYKEEYFYVIFSEKEDNMNFITMTYDFNDRKPVIFYKKREIIINEYNIINYFSSAFPLLTDYLCHNISKQNMKKFNKLLFCIGIDLFNLTEEE